MEVLALTAMVGAAGIAAQILAWAVAGVLYPLFWVWMLVDAILREDAEYPGSSENSRLVWVLLVALLHPAAIVYFFMVYAKSKRSATVQPA